MVMKGLEQIQFGVFFDFHAQVVELLDRGIACEEVERPRSKCDDLKSGKSHDRAGNRHEFFDHVGTFLGRPHRVFRDIGPDIAEF